MISLMNTITRIIAHIIVYCLDKFKTQIMCYDSLAAFKLVPDWFVTSKIIKTGSIYQILIYFNFSRYITYCLCVGTYMTI